MSGHSKWATIHRQKEIKDNARGKVFSKFANLITIAAKEGGPNPDTNFKLRDIIEKAKAANMPKDNIDRAMAKASGGGAAMEEVMYEGFGPNGLPVLIQAVTDNRNRTGQEIKNILERSGGSLAGPGAVAFQFDQVGDILVEKSGNVDEQTLTLIDLGVDDIEETQDGIECYVPPTQLYQKRQEIEAKGLKVLNSEIIMKPKTYQDVSEQDMEKISVFLEALENQDDVQKVFTTV